MNFLRSSFVLRRILYVAMLIITIAAIIMIAQTQVNTSMNDSEKYETWKQWAQITASAAGVIAVVAGMFIIHWTSKLSDIQKEQNHKLQLGIAEANDHAATAQKESQKASQLAEEARARQKEAELREKQVELELTRLTSSVKQTSKKTDIATEKAQSAEEKAREAFKKTEYRKIPELVVTDYRSELSKYKNETIMITCLLGDQESFSLASQLKTIFESSGWKVNGVNQAAYTAPVPGIVIVLKTQSEQPKGELIAKFLESANLSIRGEINDKSESGIALIIGAR